MTDIYNDNSYIEKNPTLHTEDSEFKFQNIKRFLNSIEVKNNKIKIIDRYGYLKNKFLVSFSGF